MNIFLIVLSAIYILGLILLSFLLFATGVPAAFWLISAYIFPGIVLLTISILRILGINISWFYLVTLVLIAIIAVPFLQKLGTKLFENEKRLTYDYSCDDKNLKASFVYWRSQGISTPYEYKFEFSYDGSIYNGKNEFLTLTSQERKIVDAIEADSLKIDPRDFTKKDGTYEKAIKIQLYGTDVKKNGKEFSLCLLRIKDDFVNNINKSTPNTLRFEDGLYFYSINKGKNIEDAIREYKLINR